MINEPLVSIIIPTYNRSVLLQQTLKSILAQTYRNFEIILISDASTDDTSPIVHSFKDERIKFTTLNENLKYPSRVRNIGIEKANGEFIAFCDDDDLWMEHKLKTQIKFLFANENIELVASNSYLFPGHIVPSMQLLWNKNLNYEELLKQNSIITPSVLIRKRTLHKIGKFDESGILHIGEDWDLWLRVLQHKKNSVIILKECLVFNRLGNIKITNLYFRPKKNIEARLHIYRKHRPYTNKKIKLLTDKLTVEIEKNTRRILIHQTSRELYSKSKSKRDIFFLKELNLKNKLIIFFKLYFKYIYKFLVQKRTSIEI